MSAIINGERMPEISSDARIVSTPSARISDNYYFNTPASKLPGIIPKGKKRANPKIVQKREIE